MLTGPEKIEFLRERAQIYQCPTFVETGTADGETVGSLSDLFERLYTIELDEIVSKRAGIRFAEEGRRNITCIAGDSDPKLNELVQTLEGPVMFWLDAHFCGGARAEVDTPIMEELEHIFTHRPEQNVVFIDDARLFGTDPSYPSIEWIQDFMSAYPNYAVAVADDIIRIVPKEAA